MMHAGLFGSLYKKDYVADPLFLFRILNTVKSLIGLDVVEQMVTAGCHIDGPEPYWGTQVVFPPNQGQSLLFQEKLRHNITLRESSVQKGEDVPEITIELTLSTTSARSSRDRDRSTTGAAQTGTGRSAPDSSSRKRRAESSSGYSSDSSLHSAEPPLARRIASSLLGAKGNQSYMSKSQPMLAHVRRHRGTAVSDDDLISFFGLTKDANLDTAQVGSRYLKSGIGLRDAFAAIRGLLSAEKDASGCLIDGEIDYQATTSIAVYQGLVPYILRDMTQSLAQLEHRFAVPPFQDIMMLEHCLLPYSEGNRCRYTSKWGFECICTHHPVTTRLVRLLAEPVGPSVLVCESSWFLYRAAAEYIDARAAPIYHLGDDNKAETIPESVRRTYSAKIQVKGSYPDVPEPTGDEETDKKNLFAMCSTMQTYLVTPRDLQPLFIVVSPGRLYELNTMFQEPIPTRSQAAFEVFAPSLRTGRMFVWCPPATPLVPPPVVTFLQLQKKKAAYGSQTWGVTFMAELDSQSGIFEDKARVLLNILGNVEWKRPQHKLHLLRHDTVQETGKQYRTEGMRLDKRPAGQIASGAVARGEKWIEGLLEAMAVIVIPSTGRP